MKIRFGPFTLDLDTRQLTQDGREIHLAPKAFELLVTLVLDRPKVLSKARCCKRLWPDTFVAEANLSNLVAEIREALGDHARAPVYPDRARVRLRVLRRRHHAAGRRDSGPDRPPCWLEWGRRRFPLSVGRTRHRTRSRCRRQARRIDGVAPSRAARGHG